MSERIGWLDCSAGVAGDMLLAALVDAGVPAGELAQLIEAVLPDSVDLVVTEVTRAGLRATKVDVRPLVEQPPHRTWADIEQLVRSADLPTGTRDRALSTFGRLAGAEARVHGIPVADVHFHEVGALDSIADVVGVCAGFDQLGLDRLVAGRVALGSGSARGAHGRLAVPVPAVLELSAGWPVTSGGEGELATPTGMALVTALADTSGELPPMTVEQVGIGAGTRDVPGRANVTRLVVGLGAGAAAAAEIMTVLETNVDDLDPRLWPGVLTALLEGGAADAWLTPVLAKKGRPAHVLSVLASPDRAVTVRDVVLTRTSSLGVRTYDVRRYALPRMMIEIALAGGTIAVKIGHRDGVVLQVTPEFADVSAYAARRGRTETEVMAEALAAASARGYRGGAPLPE
ncbi:MAG TPA: nickel pincer cofactor biosynthesis protein LarC [Microlunatus sp.]|nr:nickel pincer cofactor biosynthesis protein LarC [Microlunatus sp.]